MTLVLVAAALGAAGTGSLASRTAGARGGQLTVGYDRVVRREAPTTLELRVAGGGGDSAIWIDAAYLDRVRIRSITPTPQEDRLGGARRVFVFAQASARGGGTIAVELEPTAVGSLAGEAGVVGGAAVAFRQFVLP